MKMMHFFMVVLVVMVTVFACTKENSLESADELNAKHNKALGSLLSKDTCVVRNGKDSCFKLPVPRDTTHQGGGKDSSHNGGHGPVDTIYNGGPKDTTYYPGGWKDSCIKRNGVDTCFKLPIPRDTSIKKTN